MQSEHTGLSRNTIKKYLNAGTVEPKFVVPERPSKLDPYADKLAAWLRSETSKSHKQRRPLTRLHADLIALGSLADYEAYRARLAADPPDAGTKQLGRENYELGRREGFIRNESRLFVKLASASHGVGS